LTDCDGENSETDASLDFAKQCGYISLEQHYALTGKCAAIGRMLGGMIKKSESFLFRVRNVVLEVPWLLSADDWLPISDF
jgi:hypothetical protein